MSLQSFGPSAQVAVFGASGGIGHALIAQLQSDPNVATIHAFSRTPPATVGKVIGHGFDPESDEKITQAIAALDGVPISLALVTIGTLHDGTQGPEKSIRALTTDRLLEVMRINMAIPALIGKNLLPHMKGQQRAVFAALSARVGSISDNQLGGWYSYRASKAALNQIVRTLSIELGQKNPNGVAVTLHPGTVQTALSAPFQRNVPAEKLFTPAFSATALLGVVDKLTPADTGQCFDWAGKPIAP